MDELDDLLDPNVKQEGGDYGGNNNLPNANATLVLGIISIVGCFMYGVPGFICGVIALSLHGKDKRLYNSNPQRYENSFKNAKAGFVCAVIGTSLSAIFVLVLILAFASIVNLGRF